MSYLRDLRAVLTARRGRPSAAPWQGYRTVEDFSYALAMAGTDTDTACGLLRQARPYFRAMEAQAEQREAAQYRREMVTTGAALAAEKLRRMTGYEVEEDPEPAIAHHYYADSPRSNAEMMFGPWGG